MADDQRRGIDESDPCVDPSAGVKIDAHWHQRRWNQGDEAAITQPMRTLAAGVSAPMSPIKRLAVTGWRRMKGDQDRHARAERQTAGPLPLTTGEELAMPSREERPADIIDIAKHGVSRKSLKNLETQQ